MLLCNNKLSKIIEVEFFLIFFLLNTSVGKIDNTTNEITLQRRRFFQTQQLKPNGAGCYNDKQVGTNNQCMG